MTIVDARARDIEGFPVRRILPALAARHVGPFVFLDHMGPKVFAPGTGMDVRPHPHIGLATVTYLFDGEILHRDSVGSEKLIRPGDVNWMIAGRGIAHSERTRPETRARGATLHGLQMWVGLPQAEEARAPGFRHYPAATLPVLDRDGAHLRLMVGTAFGATSPVEALSPTVYVDATMPAGAALRLPDEHEERAIYVVEGALTVADGAVATGQLFVATPGAPTVARATVDTRAVIIGGAPLDGGPRHMWWNFVASDRAAIERAKDDWRARRFAPIPGDDAEHVPLPD